MRLQRSLLASLLVVPLSLILSSAQTTTPNIQMPAAGNIATFAGNGYYVAGNADGNVSDARFATPDGLALDSIGNIYIADKNDNRVRKIDKTGHITTVAGTGTPGTPTGTNGDGGPAISAQLTNPVAVAVDASGNLYIADYGNNRIRKVTADGIISTVAGNGVAPTIPYDAANPIGDGGLATSAQLNDPSAIAVDTHGNLYIADTSNNRVRIVSGGIINTFAGTGEANYGGDNGLAVNAKFTAPKALALDAVGNLYIADQYNYRIRKVDISGIITTIAGDGTVPPSTYDPAAPIGDGGLATSAKLNGPAGLALDATGSNLYVTDQDNKRIRKIDLTTGNANSGIISTVAGNGTASPGGGDGPTNLIGDGGPATSAEFSRLVAGIAVSSNYLYIADFGNDAVRVVNLSPACSYALSAPTATLSPAAGDSNVTLTTPTGCGWTATSNASWLTVTAGAQGSANGTVAFHVDANPAITSRTGTLTIGGQTMTVTQDGNPTAAAAPGALRFVPVTPCRVADTRDPDGPFGGPLLPGQTTRDFILSQSACGIPANAQAYSLNFTVVPAGKLNYLTVFPTGQPQPVASTLNSRDGRIKANAAIVPAGTNGAVSVFATDDTQLIIDVNGYFVPASTDTALAFYPMTPCRLVDTREAAGPLGAPSLSARQERVFPVLTSSCQVPATAQAYSLNYTVVPKGPLGYLTTWPTGQAQPTVSTLNAPTGTITANAAIVPAGDMGNLSVYVTHDTNMIIDINGYFAPPASGGLSLYNLAPCRVYDSRTQADAQPVLNTTGIDVAGSSCNAPPSAQSYIFNATVVPTHSLLFLTLWPHGEDSQPNASALNAPDGAVTSNLAIVPTTDGSINAFTSHSTHLILDIFGYFAP